MRFSNRLSQKLVVTIPWTFWFVVNTDDGNEAGKVARDILKAIDADLRARLDSTVNKKAALDAGFSQPRSMPRVAPVKDSNRLLTPETRSRTRTSAV